MKKTLLIGLMLLPVVAFASGSEAQWEQALNQAWKDLSPKQRQELRAEERAWIKVKDALPAEQRYDAIRDRTFYLQNYKTGQIQPVVPVVKAAVAQTAIKIDNPTDLTPAQLALTTDHDSVMRFLEDYFKRVNPNMLPSDSSLFIEVQIGAYTFLIAKISVNTPMGPIDQGCVFDFNHNWAANLPLDSYREFLRTGNRFILGEHNLNPLG